MHFGLTDFKQKGKSYFLHFEIHFEILVLLATGGCMLKLDSNSFATTVIAHKFNHHGYWV